MESKHLKEGGIGPIFRGSERGHPVPIQLSANDVVNISINLVDLCRCFETLTTIGNAL